MPSLMDINVRVKAQYEAFPYPDYRLGLPLRAQEAYASHSLFAARLLEQRGRVPALRRQAEPRVLIAGCGDTFPYLASCWEPRRHRLIAADLSASNLRRARMRCLPRLRGIDWRMGNLEDPEFALPGGLSHIDCYGVLHHLASPGRVLRRFGELLLPGGTARVMVYNSAARGWLRHLQRAFDLLGLDGLDREDIRRARRILERLSAISPALRDRFAPLRLPGGAFASASRFVDTFLHAREARLGLDHWLAAIAAGGLEVIGLYDRYGELDDLPNPLLGPPDTEAWRERIADRRFENNLELFLAKPGTGAQGASVTCRLPSPLSFRSPPSAWFAYPETRSLPWLFRRRLWTRFLNGLCRLCDPGEAAIDSWAGRLPPEALQRLARLGALFPDDFGSLELKELLLRPRHDSMEPPEFAAPRALREDRELRSHVASLLGAKQRPARHLDAVMNRFQAAQAP